MIFISTRSYITERLLMGRKELDQTMDWPLLSVTVQSQSFLNPYFSTKGPLII